MRQAREDDQEVICSSQERMKKKTPVSYEIMIKKRYFSLQERMVKKCATPASQRERMIKECYSCKPVEEE